MRRILSLDVNSIFTAVAPRGAVEDHWLNFLGPTEEVSPARGWRVDMGPLRVRDQLGPNARLR